MKQVLVITFIVGFIFGSWVVQRHLDDNTYSGCDPTQYLELGTVGIIKCYFEAGFDSVIWYDSADTSQSEPIADTSKTTPIPDNGRNLYYATCDGSLIITTVSLDHARTFTVLFINSRYEKPTEFSVDVVIIGPLLSIGPYVLHLAKRILPIVLTGIIKFAAISSFVYWILKGWQNAPTLEISSSGSTDGVAIRLPETDASLVFPPGKLSQEQEVVRKLIQRAINTEDGHGPSTLKVGSSISTEGATIQIPGTDIALVVPPGALLKEREVEMTLIQQVADAECKSSFSSNSAAVVELLPNGLEFQSPVKLILPHCLKLKKGYSKENVKVLIRHHNKESSSWEVMHDTKYELTDNTCIISLQRFCWITFEVNDEFVEAKRIKIYTAGKNLNTSDCLSEVEVGFCRDLPGNGEILNSNKGMVVGQWKPFLFLKDETKPLEIELFHIIPKHWTLEEPQHKHQTISYRNISMSNEQSCPFALERKEENGGIPLCIFKVYQADECITITFRPEVEHL